MNSTRDPAASEQMEAAFWEAQTLRMRYQELFDFAADGYLVTDLRGMIRETNYAAALLLNARKEFLIGKPLGLYLAEKSRAVFYAMLGRPSNSDGQAREMLVGMPRGEPRRVLLTMTVLVAADGQASGLRWTLRDVSVARRVEDALHAEKGLADCLLDLSEILILIVDAQGRICRWNSFLQSVSGRNGDELLGRDWCEALLCEEDRDAGQLLMERIALHGSAKSGILGLAPRRGTRRYVAWSARQLDETRILVGHDVTQLQDSQRHALQAERLAAIGQMATGLAHESRNALQRIQACLSILMLRLKNEPELLELLDRAQKAQDDVRRLFEDVRTYAAALPLRFQRCEVRQIWREAWENLRSSPGHASAELREDAEGVDLFCFADPFYLRQVFRNILENSLTTGVAAVRIVIRCCSARLGEDDAIQLSVRDNGPGFAPTDRQRLFEPFFTTKFKGTGLGLAICKRIVESHGGRIETNEGAGPGAEVLITLPRRRP
ncbi:MAG TPA: ATP-binding protein [Gemmataceae bacterium]|jgi:hypothetical protein